MKKYMAAVVSGLCAVSSHALSNPQARESQGQAKDSVTLKEVVVSGEEERNLQLRSTQNVVGVNQAYLQRNFAGSLMQSLEDIPGVKAMDIGSGQSKPAIRGLGFNRLAVTLDGVKYEGQQWGQDHGLEVDQFAVDRLDIVKGPGALLYGSDAISGVINLHTEEVPDRKLAGGANLFMRTNNQSLGVAAKVDGKKGRFFYKANLTLLDYADYKVPTDSIEYFSYNIKLYKRRLRNTAGREQDGSLWWGYAGDRFKTSFKVADVNTKSGFFANAHGLEVRLSQIDYDKSSRDIDLPYQTANHLTVMNRTTLRTGKWYWEALLAWQRNARKEWAEAVSDGYMPIPPNTLERSFLKNTYSANLNVNGEFGRHTLHAGASMEHQRNRRGGWDFVLPAFESTAAGVYASDDFEATDRLTVSAGVRYDWSRIHTHSYQDWFKTPVAEADSVYRQRSADRTRNFQSFTFSAGLNYHQGNWILKLNAGKSFRTPQAHELGADGVNYDIFRYEKGMPTLKPEESYQVDGGVYYHAPLFDFQVEPYFNYFPNYIYLNPTSEYYDGLQVYYYTQCKVIRFGMEAEARYRFLRYLQAGVEGEYLYARQRSGDKKGFTLPFSAPWSMNVDLKYFFRGYAKPESGYASLTWKIVGDQNEIVPPELPTKGHQILNLAAGKTFQWKGCRLNVSIQAQNLFNKRYYDHTSYYRLIGVPEPGRNFAAMVGVEF